MDTRSNGNGRWVSLALAGLITILGVLTSIAHNSMMSMLRSLDERVGRIESLLLRK